MRGGARATSGPPPDPHALRRDRDKPGDWETLAAEGRQGPAPEWPLSQVSKRESDLWKREWERPQAVVWERNGQEIEVAMYVRTLVAAEKKDAAANVRTLTKQQQEALGISLPGLSRNKWRIESADAERSDGPARVAPPSAKHRFKVVEGGAA